MSRDGTQSRSGGRASPDARGRNSRGTASNRTPDLRGQTGTGAQDVCVWTDGELVLGVCVDGRGTGTQGVWMERNWYSGSVRTDGKLVLRVCGRTGKLVLGVCWLRGNWYSGCVWTERELVLMVCGWRGNWYSGCVWTERELVLMVCGWRGNWYSGSVDRRELVLRVCGPTGNWYSGCVDWEGTGTLANLSNATNVWLEMKNNKKHFPASRLYWELAFICIIQSFICIIVSFNWFPIFILLLLN